MECKLVEGVFFELPYCMPVTLSHSLLSGHTWGLTCWIVSIQGEIGGNTWYNMLRNCCCMTLLTDYGFHPPHPQLQVPLQTISQPTHNCGFDACQHKLRNKHDTLIFS